MYDFKDVTAGDAPEWFRNIPANSHYRHAILDPGVEGFDQRKLGYVDQGCVKLNRELIVRSVYTVSLMCAFCTEAKVYEAVWGMEDSDTSGSIDKVGEEIQETGWKVGLSLEFGAEGMMCASCWAREVAYRAHLASLVQKAGRKGD